MMGDDKPAEVVMERLKDAVRPHLAYAADAGVVVEKVLSIMLDAMPLPLPKKKEGEIQEMIQEAGQLLFGRDYVRQLAEALGVSRRSVQRWSDGFVRVPPGVWEDLGRLVEEKERASAALMSRITAVMLDERTYAEHFPPPRRDEK